MNKIPFSNTTLASGLLLVLLTGIACAQQTPEPQLIGGSCEGCEAIFEHPKEPLPSIDTIPDFYLANHQNKRIIVSGTVYLPDGKTPAKGVILYIYHTNQQGLYQANKSATGWGKHHGYNRIWLTTDENGYYAYYTLKPAPYPNRSEPAHIHYTVLEPRGYYYWLGSCRFAGDSLLTYEEINPQHPRGGSSGLLTLKKEHGIWVGQRDIILGKNIPGYE